jgi:aryl-alcohol dehydrogenase-like predicted oxidoreductase
MLCNGSGRVSCGQHLTGAQSVGRHTASVQRRPDLVLGTMMFGDSISGKESHRMMDYAFDHGVRMFDTAEMYPVPQSADTQGASERCIGSWMKHRDRSSVQICTKVAGPAAMSWLRGGPVTLDAKNIKEAVEQSLQRLQTEYVDLLLLHWPDRYVPMFGDDVYDVSYSYSTFSSFEEQIDAMLQLHEQGKIVAFGLSNETPYGVMKFCEASRQYSLKPSVLQNAYSLLCRTFECGGLAECCHMEGIGLMAYSPLAMGLLSGKYLGGACQDPEARLVKFKGRYAEAESRYGPKPNVYDAIAAYVKLAEKHHMSPVELALRFVMSHPQMESVVIGASTLQQLDELIQIWNSGGIILDEDILDELHRIHTMFPNPTP